MDVDDDDRRSPAQPPRGNLALEQQQSPAEKQIPSTTPMIPSEKTGPSRLDLNNRNAAVAMPELQLFDLVAGGAFERALEVMGRQHHGAQASTLSVATRIPPLFPFRAPQIILRTGNGVKISITPC